MENFQHVLGVDDAFGVVEVVAIGGQPGRGTMTSCTVRPPN
jgi:hypothetical protein